MKLTSKDVVMQCLERIEVLHQLQKDYCNILYVLRDRRRNRIDEIKDGNIYTVLIEEELDEWRKLLIWGITLDNKDKDRLKAAVYNRFLKPGVSVMYWLGDGCNTPSKWFTQDEAEFREMIEQTFLSKSERDVNQD